MPRPSLKRRSVDFTSSKSFGLEHKVLHKSTSTNSLSSNNSAGSTVSLRCNARDTKDASLPNIIVPARDLLKPKRIRSFGDLSKAVTVDGQESPQLSLSDSESDDSVNQLSNYKVDKAAARKRSLVEKVLLSTWDEKFEKGLFKYDVLDCPSKRISGKYAFVAQLNEGRAAKKRSTEFTMAEVRQNFDANKFNFQKATQDEVLFQFELSPGEYTSSYEDLSEIKGDANFVYINISPIEYGHVLLVPKVMQGIPQQMDNRSLLTALHMAVEVNNPCFKIGFNTLGAYATINHLHFQGYFLTAPFPVERSATEPLGIKTGAGSVEGEGGDKSTLTKGRDEVGVSISQLVDYPVRALVFELGSNLEELAEVVANSCRTLEGKNIPYNLLVVDCGARVFLFPQKFDLRKSNNEIPEHVLETQVNPAAFEIGGHMVMKRKEDYETITEEKVCELLSYASLTGQEFEALVSQLFD